LIFIGSELGAYGREARRMAEGPGQDASACYILFLEKLTRAETFAAYKATDLVL
jgi:hypothetical protein